MKGAGKRVSARVSVSVCLSVRVCVCVCVCEGASNSFSVLCIRALNAEKTEVLPIASTSCLSLVGGDNVDIGGKHIAFKSSVRNVGVHLDQASSMQQQISSVCRTAYLELRRIASIQPHLPQNATAQLVSSAIASWLDYCNSILAGSRFHAYRESKTMLQNTFLEKFETRMTASVLKPDLNT